MNNKTVLDTLNARLELMTSLTNKAIVRLKEYPEGRIEIKHIGGKPYFYYINGKTQPQSLDKENNLIQKLIQKSYLEQVIQANNKEIAIIQKLINHYPSTTAEDIYNQLNKDRQRFVKPIITPLDQYVQEWQEQPYKRKPIAEGTPFFETLRGERVRSKSEQIIADRLNVNGIPYKYECPLKVGNAVFHPDFTILRKSDRRILYHEHLGKMDDDEYKNDNVSRINFYILNGFLLGETLFLSLESSVTPLDVRVIDKMINEHFK